MRQIGLALVLILGWGGDAGAVPARGDEETFVQPDGTTFRATQHGDEFFNWVSTPDGVLVRRHGDGSWRFTAATQGRVSLLPQHPGRDLAPKGAATERDLPAIRAQASADQQGIAGAAPETTVSAAGVSAPTEPLLVILVQFSDRALTTTPGQWTNVLFGTSGKTLRTYYDEVSRNTFHFVPAAETYGTTNDGIVVVTLPYAHPNTSNTFTTANQLIVSNALAAADAYVDFSGFDANHDSVLANSELHVATVVAGYEKSYATTSTPSVWGHHWSLFSPVGPPKLDGVSVSGSPAGGYIQVGEIHGTHMATVGIFCHELGHDLGLIDLYDTDGSSEGIGGHGVMGAGSWGYTSGEFSGATPTLMCAWSRIRLGFLSPTPVVSSDVCTAYQSSATASANVFKVFTSDTNQYFLIENRQLTGFDAGLYGWFSSTAGGAGGGGLAIWHIDDSVAVNTNEFHKRVDLEEANEAALGYSELDLKTNRANRLHYYYGGKVTQFDDTTVPNTRLYSGVSTYVAVSQVSSSGAAMTFRVGTGTRPLTVASDYGATRPPLGVSSYPYGSQVTCAVTNSPVTVSDTQSVVTLVCTGWVGTGSVPAVGAGTNVVVTLIDTSSVTWLWGVRDLVLSNQTVAMTTNVSALRTITAGNGYSLDPAADVTFRVGTGGLIRLTPGFSAPTGSAFRATLP